MGYFKKLYNSFFGKIEKEKVEETGQLPRPSNYDYEHATAVIRSMDINDKALLKAASKLIEAIPELETPINRAFRRGQSYSNLDFTPDQQRNVIKRARHLADLQPYASRAMEIRSNLIVSEGLYPKATSKNESEREALEEVLNTHWNLNEWDRKMLERVRSLGITGEMFRLKPVTTLDLSTGEKFNLSKFRCYTIVPEDVVSIYQDLFDCDYLTQAVVKRSVGNGAQGYTEEFLYNLVNKNLIDPRTPMMQGDLFFTAVNRPSGGTRGRSDLLPVLEWLDVNDQVLFNESERSSQMLKFMFDVSIDNASPQMISQRKKDLISEPPQRGSSIIHPSTEKWSVIQPDLQSSESDVLANRLFIVVWGAMGLPEHWYAQANTVNKSSGEEMSIPVWSWARGRKQIFIQALREELQYAIQVAKESKALNKNISEDFEIQSRDPDRTAYDQLASALKSTAEAMQTATTSGMIDVSSASKVFVHIANAMGLEIPDQAVDQIQMDARKAMEVSEEEAPAKTTTMKKLKDTPANIGEKSKQNKE